MVLTAGFYFLTWSNARLFAPEAVPWDASIRLDQLIPFSPGWVWIYILYFPACFLPLVFVEVRRRIETFRRTALGYGLQFAVAFIFFALIPLRMARPEIVPSDLTETVLHGLYRIDPGFNLFPSLHVANTAFIACLTWSLRGPAAGLLAWGFCLLISVSALLVKQHYFVDIPAGVLLGGACYLTVFSEGLVFPGADRVLAPGRTKTARTPAPAEASLGSGAR
ncbi:MAG: phosphatase PAP2 family protein [Elusimicrobiota bacterium]